MIGVFALVALMASGMLVASLLATRASYNGGFWDGVCWERERLEGGDYPSRPDDSWWGWSELERGAETRRLRGGL